MSIRATVWAWRIRGIAAPQKVVLARYADLAAADGGNAWCPVRRLARQTCMSERTVRTALRGLEAAGLITVTTPADVATHRTMTYRLNIPADFDHTKPEDDDESTPGAGDAPALGQEMPQPPAPDAPAPRQEMPQAGAGAAPNTAYDVPKRRSNNKGSASALSRANAQPAFDGLLIEEEAAEPKADIVEQMVSIWREELKGIVPVPSKLDAALRRAAKQRLADSCGGSLEAWSMAVQKIAASTFLTGGGKQGWRATFKWILKPGNLQRLADGEFDDTDRKPAGPRSMVETMAEIAADMEAEAAGLPRKRKSDAAARMGPAVRWAMGRTQGRDRQDDIAETFDAIRRKQGAFDHD